MRRDWKDKETMHEQVPFAETRTEIIGQCESLEIVAGIRRQYDREGLRLLMEYFCDWKVHTIGIMVFPNGRFHIGGTFAKSIQLCKDKNVMKYRQKRWGRISDAQRARPSTANGQMQKRKKERK